MSQAEIRPLAAVFSLEGPELTLEEARLFSRTRPFGYILFARNCQTPQQLYRLTRDLRDNAGWDCPVFIDQEGGRVQRLRGPDWPDFPPAAYYGAAVEKYPEEGAQKLHQDMAALAGSLARAGISVNCAPVCDLGRPGTHHSIGDRAFSDKPEIVRQCALTLCQAFRSRSIIPVLKHIPGHGQADVDSHLTLPVVHTDRETLETEDFSIFRDLARDPDLEGVMGMMGHVLYKQLDPAMPASASRRIIRDLVRRKWAFDGLILSDDISMEALAGLGPVEQRAPRLLEAGCDVVLYCAGRADEMEAIAGICPPVTDKTWQRWLKARKFARGGAGHAGPQGEEGS